MNFARTSGAEDDPAPAPHVKMADSRHQLILSPHGRLLCEATATADSGQPEWGEIPSVVQAFANSSAQGLLALAALRKAGSTLAVEFVFWRAFAEAYLTKLAHAPEPAEGQVTAEIAPPAELFFDLTLRIPAMRGAEYAAPEVFAKLWGELDALAREEARTAGGLKTWLGRINPALHLLGKVTFHLAENKRSPATPRM